MSVSTFSPTVSFLAVLTLVPGPSPRVPQVVTACDCHPDSFEQEYECCDVTSSYVSISTPAQHPRCWDLGNCNEQTAVPCEWFVTMRITTLTHHDFEGLHNGQVVVSGLDARGLNWAEHKVNLDCDFTAVEVITCDGAPCLEVDLACWDCIH